MREWIEQGCTFIAHNAEGFDAPAWARFGYGSPSWCDTIHMCRAGALPAGLDRACKALGISGKDEEGRKALELLYRVRTTKAGYVYPVGTIPLWKAMLKYNVWDVHILEQLYERVKDFGEPDVMQLHSEINDRGIPVDLKYAERLRLLWMVHQKQAALD